MNKDSDKNRVTDRSSSDNSEISLVDLVRILFEHRRTTLIVFLVFLISGTAFALLMPKQYRYTTTIEIGTIMEDSKTLLIDRPGTLVAKIKEAYIPHVLDQFNQSAQPTPDEFKIKARIPPDSEIIVLESQAPDSDRNTLVKLHRQVVDLVKHNHQRVFEIMKKEMNVELDKGRNKLEALQDQHKALTADLKRMDQTSKLLGNQIEALQALVADAINYRKMARTQTGDEAQAMTLLMIDNEIMQNRQYLATLEERLYVELPREKDTLENMISDNLREQQEQTAEIAKTEAAVNNMRETQMLISPMRSANPVGAGRMVIITVSAVTGLFAGIFAAFIAAFVRKARHDLHLLEQD